MKFSLFAILCFLSSFSNAANLSVFNGEFSSPFIGGTGYCSSTTCVGSVYDPVIYKDVNDTGEEIPATETYFFDGNDMVERKMAMNIIVVPDTSEDLLLKISWDSGLLYSGLFGIGGFVFDLLETPSGYLEIVSNSGFWGYLDTKANSIDSFAIFNVDYEPLSSVSEVPIPAPLFMLLPVLFGLFSYRRKLF